MKTRGEAMSAILDAAEGRLVDLLASVHDPVDVNDVLANVGTRLELFYKEAVFPDATVKDTADGLIGRLKAVGIDKDVRGALERARIACNGAKHDPAYTLPIEDALKRVGEAREAVAALVAANVGRINSPSLREPLQRFWIAAADHFTHGEMEFYVYLPFMRGGWPIRFDTYSIDMGLWDDVRERLGDSLSLGRGTVPDSFFDACASDVDFYNAGEYRGEYQVLAAAMSSGIYREEEVVPGLRREDDVQGMKAALFMATVDVARANATTENLDEFRELLLATSSSQYGVRPEASVPTALAPVLARLLLAIPSSARESASGPIWVDESGFERYEKRSDVRDLDWGVGLDRYGYLYARLDI